MRSVFWLAAFVCIGSLPASHLIADDHGAVKFVAPKLNSASSSLEELLADATELEKQNRWSEALQLYQSGMRTYPENGEIRDRHLLAQIHYELNRRYADASYRQTVATKGSAQALATYADVVNKIQVYHVNNPDWRRIVQTGAQCLEIAILHPEFAKLNIPAQKVEHRSLALGQIHQTLANYPAASSQDAYVMASSLAKQMQESLGVPPAATIYELIFGAVYSLDPYSSFMTETQYDETMSQIEGNFVGLGVELKTWPLRLEVVNVIPQGPAAEAGLLPGDLILSVDGRTTADIGSEVAADLLRGAEGSQAQLIIQRGQTQYQAQVVRRHVEIPSISEAKIIDPELGVGHIRIASFQRTTTRDFDAAMSRLYAQGMRSLVIDVRGNPGGLLTSSVEIADRFIDSGVIVSTHGRNPLEDFVHRATRNNTWRMPLVVLVDENSASASEIFAAAIADHQRGRIVGTRSYGKGSVQGIFPLSSGGGLRLTTAKFFSPSGKAIQQNGVSPDVEVTVAAKPSENAPEVDTWLTVAVQSLQSGRTR